MYCRHCGARIEGEAKFCPECGGPLTPTRPGTTPPGVTPSAVTGPTGSDPGILDAETVIGPRAVSEIAAGTVLAERYEVRELLGSGGMGAVYRVFDRELGREIALKVLHPELVSSETAVARFVREAQVSLELAHPNIVRVHHIGRVGELRYLTMELLTGRSLRAHLEEVKARGERLPVSEAKEILEQVLSALAYAHRVTVHRDVKPENVFLEEQPGGGFRVKLLDFGIAKVLDRETFTRTSTSLGTAWYVAPEQLADGGEVDARADLYSVGVLAYELLTGGLPVGRVETPSELRDDVPSAWDGWVFRAMDRRPERRFASAEEMLSALRTLPSGVADEGIPAKGAVRAGRETAPVPGTGGERADTPVVRRRGLPANRVVALAVAAAILAALGVVGARWYGEHRRIARLEAAVEAALSAKDVPAARSALAALRSGGGDAEEIRAYEVRIETLAKELARAKLAEGKSAQLQGLQEKVVDALADGRLDAAETYLGEYRKAGGDAGSAARLEESLLAKRLERAFGRKEWKNAWSLVARLEKVPGAAEAARSWREKVAAGQREDLSARIRGAIGRGRFAEAERLVASLAKVPGGKAPAEALTRDLLMARARAALKAGKYEEALHLAGKLAKAPGGSKAGKALREEVLRAWRESLTRRARAAIEGEKFAEVEKLAQELAKVPGGKETADGLGKEIERARAIAAARKELEGAVGRLDVGAAEKALGRLESFGVSGEVLSSSRKKVEELQAFLVKGGSRPGQRVVAKIRGVDFAFRWIPAGEDVIGSPPGEPCRFDDERQWTAVISRGFWMGETEVTQRQWEAVTGSNPSHFKGCPDCPVENVSWNDAQEFVRKLNELVPGGGFRLPWEAEWEYACRAGSDGPFNVPCPGYSKGNCTDHVSCLDGIAWYDESSGGKTHPVAQLKANAWGLHDCHGNVWEWCGDWYREEYPRGRVTDWHGPSSGSKRVLRGGSWYDYARSVRAANRDWDDPGARSGNCGVRLLRAVR